MNLVVDLIVVLILSFCILRGYMKGFVATILSMFGGLICFTLSVLIARPVGTFLSKLLIRPICHSYFEKAFLDLLESSKDSTNVNSVLNAASDFFKRYGISDQDLNSLLKSSGNNSDKLIDKVVSTVSTPISDAIGFIIAFVVILIVVIILYKMLVKVLDLVAKLPVLNASNKTLGLIFGIIHGIILATAFSCVLYYIEPLNPVSSFNFSLDDTYLARFLSSIAR